MPGLQAVVEDKFKGWLISTGLPGDAFVATVVSDSPLPVDRVVRLFLEDKELLYPETLAGEAGFSVAGQIPDVLLEEKNVIQHFEFEGYPDRLQCFYVTLFQEICQWNCESFINPAVVDALAGMQSEFASFVCKELIKAGELARIRPSWLSDALASVGDRTDLSDVRELLLDQSGDPEISLHISENYLKALTVGNLEDTVPFKKLDEDLFYTLGIDFPDVTILFDDQLTDRGMRFSINGVRSLEFQGLFPGEYLVKAEAGELDRAGYSHTGFNYPGWSGPMFRVRSGSKQELAIYSPISALEFIAIIFHKFLASSAWQFIKLSRVKKIIDEVNLQSPSLTDLALQQYTIPMITWIFRYLMKENISLRNVELILQALIDFDWIEANEGQYVVFDDRLPMTSMENFLENRIVYIAEFVRTNLKNYICYQFRGPNNTLPVFVMDSGTEELLISSAAHSLSQELQMDILNEIRSTIGDGWLNAEPVNIVTTSEVRPLLRSILQKRYPFINVFSHHELSPYLSIQIAGRMKPLKMVSFVTET